ncbi:MAG: hypothetical protein NC453_19670 [Muribaculum sp.]|nr:hypothetical protein [Muribaculum sp.]
MRKILMAVGFMAVASLLQAEIIEDNKILSIANEKVKDVSDCDTIVTYEDYNIHIVKQNDRLSHVGLNLFSDDVKKSMGKDILNRLESELLKFEFANGQEDTSVKLVSEKLKDFKRISPETSHSITNSNSHDLLVEWETEDGSVTVSMPINYQTIKGGSRSDIEMSFIESVKKYNNSRNASFDLETAEPYGDNMYIIPGYSYQKKDITRNIYLTTDSVINPIWDSKLPFESIANMFICPNDIYKDIELNVTVLKHEYGEKELFSVPLDRFLAYCEDEGCVPFWGVEKFQDGKIEGALFLYNQSQGYDHVLKIDCVPQDIIEGNGSVTARASLFIPTNNVNNLFQPYVKKTEKEKIHYDKN